jgi:hypothetical protein
MYRQGEGVMRTAASRFRTGATFAALTLGATACASGSDSGSGLAAPASTTGEDNADGSAGVSAADGGQSNAPGEDAASPTSNGPGLTPNMPGAEGGADTLPDSGAAPAADGGSGSTSPPDAGAASGGACAGGTVGTPSASAMGSPTDGDVELTVSTKTHITSLTTTLTVPTKPASQNGTLFLWPGLEPLTQSYLDVGVLQPVLTWGGTCAPGAPNNYDSWWISAQYVTSTGACAGGAGMDVAVGDQLNLAFTLSGTTWTQTITDVQTGKTVNFQKDLMGQSQNWTLFEIESDGVEPISDVIFTSTTLTFADSDPSACQPSSFGTNDYYSAPVTSTDGKACCISKIILRANGVAPTSPNSP